MILYFAIQLEPKSTRVLKQETQRGATMLIFLSLWQNKLNKQIFLKQIILKTKTLVHQKLISFFL